MAASRPASRWHALLLAATATLRLEPARMGRPRLAALVRGGRRNPDPGRAPPASSPPSRAGADCGAGASGVAGRARAAGLAPPATRRSAPIAPPASTRPCSRALADGVAITVAATLATAPLLAHHFGSSARRPPRQPRSPCLPWRPAMWLGMVKTALGQLSAPFVPDPIAGVASAAAGLHRPGCLDSRRLPRRPRRALRRHARRPAVAPAPFRRRRAAAVRPARPGRPRPPSGHHASRRPASGMGLRLAWPAALSPPPARCGADGRCAPGRRGAARPAATRPIGSRSGSSTSGRATPS